jgi:hypothetical protein
MTTTSNIKSKIVRRSPPGSDFAMPQLRLLRLRGFSLLRAHVFGRHLMAASAAMPYEWLKREFDPPPAIRTDRIWTNSGKFFPRRSRCAFLLRGGRRHVRRRRAEAVSRSSGIRSRQLDHEFAAVRAARKPARAQARLLRLAQSDLQIDNHKCQQSVDPSATSNPTGRRGCSNRDCPSNCCIIYAKRVCWKCHLGTQRARSNTMAKSQLRSTREAKKPKQPRKPSVPAIPSGTVHSRLVNEGVARKKS